MAGDDNISAPARGALYALAAPLYSGGFIPIRLFEPPVGSADA
jgi:hypothetical protein